MATVNYSVTPRETRPKPSTPKPRLKLGISNWTSDDKKCSIYNVAVAAWWGNINGEQTDW